MALATITVWCFLAGTTSASPLAARNLRFEGSNTHPAASLPATDFAVNHRPSPDGPGYTLTWAVQHATRGARQTAFAVTITDPLTAGAVWSSGRIDSEVPMAVVRGGGDLLKAARTYHWSVTVFDERGAASPRSEAAAFHIGPSDLDWAGVPWIGSNTTNLYKTTMGVAELGGAAQAVLYVCALGFGTIQVDGAPLAKGGLLAISGWTDNERLNLYETYDLSPHLADAAKGTMEIGLALGHGWRDQSKFPRKDAGEAAGDAVDRVFRAMLLVTTQSGERYDALRTPKSPLAVAWTTAVGPVVADSVYDGETYDARMETPASWSLATAVSDGPRGKMAANAFPAIALDRVYKPVSVREPFAGIFVVDFGSNVAG